MAVKGELAQRLLECLVGEQLLWPANVGHRSGEAFPLNCRNGAVAWFGVADRSKSGCFGGLRNGLHDACDGELLKQVRRLGAFDVDSAAQ